MLIRLCALHVRGYTCRQGNNGTICGLDCHFKSKWLGLHKDSKANRIRLLSLENTFSRKCPKLENFSSTSVECIGPLWFSTMAILTFSRVSNDSTNTRMLTEDILLTKMVVIYTTEPSTWRARTKSRAKCTGRISYIPQRNSLIQFLFRF